jgi:predicted naringenin-chalcone synthase
MSEPVGAAWRLAPTPPSRALGAAIAGIGIAHPPCTSQDELWNGFFAEHYSGTERALAKRIFGNSGVRRRHAAVNPIVEDVSGWSTGRRMQRYLVEAMPLGKSAVADALAVSSVDASDVGLFAVCSCTGYATPGLDVLLARDLGMAAGTKRLAIGPMGCYAALPGLDAARDFAIANQRPALLLCLELTSLHLQPPTADADQIVAHALFADAAVAVMVTPQASGYELVEVAAITDATTSDHMTWDVTDLGFRMGLSERVPDVLGQHVASMVDDLLGRHGIRREDVAGWAVHPGGPRILDVVEHELTLPAGALDESRSVLAEHGNCSSPTVLLVLDEVMRRSDAPEWIVALAFGPGLTLYGALLRAAN